MNPVLKSSLQSAAWLAFAVLCLFLGYLNASIGGYGKMTVIAFVMAPASVLMALLPPLAFCVRKIVAFTRGRPRRSQAEHVQP